MKSKLPRGFFITLLALIALFVLGLAACGEPQRTTTDLPVLVDVTDSLLAWPKADEIVSLIGLAADEMNGASFRLRTISDVSFNHETVFILAPGGNAILTNPYTRKREVAAFQKNVADSINALKKDTVVGRSHSSIYEPMARELERLSKSTATRRVLVVYSDLMENTARIDFYDPRTIAIMRSSPDTIAARMQRSAVLHDLTGITVYIVYQPKNAAEDETFRTVSSFYKAMLEQNHAAVIIGANLTH